MGSILDRRFLSIVLLLMTISLGGYAQTISDDFEGNGNIKTWWGDDCEIDIQRANPFKQGINTSNNVLLYNDTGGQYANVRFDANQNFDLADYSVFTLKLYVPSAGLTGNSPTQISLKLQDGTLPQPWETQSEIVKSITLDQWQTVTFDFKNDDYTNLNGSSLPPTLREDFNRIVIQVNGENNNDRVVAYLDDFYYYSERLPDVVYDYLVWSDEFDTNGAVDLEKWHHQTKLPNGNSWFNGEIQHYTDREENAKVEEGILTITAQRETFLNQGVVKTHTSARLNSKFAFKYGKVEIRAKLPSGVGTWPALWTLGKNIREVGGYWNEQGYGTTSWPACGEIDIMEHWGHNQNFVQSAIHTPSSFGNTVNHGGQTIATVSSAFHVYTLEWTPEKLVFSVDGKRHYIYEPAIKNQDTWPFDDEQYILMNIAIQPSISPTFTKSAMEIDYVRIYQQSPTSSSEENVDIQQLAYPNPVNDFLVISLNPTHQQRIPVKIYTISGELLLSRECFNSNNHITLDQLGHLKEGVYIVSYELNQNVKSLKFIKN